MAEIDSGGTWGSQMNWVSWIAGQAGCAGAKHQTVVRGGMLIFHSPKRLHPGKWWNHWCLFGRQSQKILFGCNDLELVSRCGQPIAESLFTWSFPLRFWARLPLPPANQLPLLSNASWKHLFFCYPYPLICSVSGFCLVLVILGDCFLIGNCMKCLVILLFGGSWGSEGNAIIRTAWPLNPVWCQYTGGFSGPRGSISFLHTRDVPRDPPQCTIHDRVWLLNSFSFGWKEQIPTQFLECMENPYHFPVSTPSLHAAHTVLCFRRERGIEGGRRREVTHDAQGSAMTFPS